METQKNKTVKNIARSILINVLNGVLYIILLNISTSTVARFGMSICWTISMAVDSINKLDNVDSVYEHMKVLEKLKKYTHQCNFSSHVVSDKITSISFENVTFSHHIGILCEKQIKHTAILNATFDFHVGKVNYITGENGNGKSSLFKAIMFNIDNGTIKFNSTNRNHIDWVKLHQIVCCVTQSTETQMLLSNDMLSNLKKQNPKLAKLFKLDEMSEISGNCRSGSGGQEQRLHIFTALCSNAQIILLDEPFSALDTQWKRTIEDILIDHAKNKLILIIGHNYFENKQCKINKFKLMSCVNGDTEIIKTL